MATRPEPAHCWSNPSWWYMLVTLPWVIGFVLMAVQSRHDTRVARREQTTPGAITGQDRSNHNSYQYTYALGGRVYREWEFPYRDDFQLGERVVVYYDPMDPATSSLRDFDDLASASDGPMTYTGVGSLAIVAYVVYNRLRKRS